MTLNSWIPFSSFVYLSSPSSLSFLCIFFHFFIEVVTSVSIFSLLHSPASLPFFNRSTHIPISVNKSLQAALQVLGMDDSMVSMRDMETTRVRVSHGTLFLSGKMTLHFYGIPKVHKIGVPLRPIVSFINSGSWGVSMVSRN